MTLQFKFYLVPKHDQEIPTKYLIDKRQQNIGKETTCNSKCRLGKHITQVVNHIISSCPDVSIMYYLPIR